MRLIKFDKGQLTLHLESPHGALLEDLTSILNLMRRMTTLRAQEKLAAAAPIKTPKSFPLPPHNVLGEATFLETHQRDYSQNLELKAL